MCKVTLVDEDGNYANCLVTANETPQNILEHFYVNIDTSNIYMNGRLLTENMLHNPIPNIDAIHIAVKPKTILSKT